MPRLEWDRDESLGCLPPLFLLFKNVGEDDAEGGDLDAGNDNAD
jgi:hypothetical protein